MSSPAQDALRLKMGGLILMVAGVAGCGFIGEAVGDGSKLLTGTPVSIAQIAGAWLIAAHVAAFGLIVLLAGLKSVPLLTSAAARRGAWQKLIGFTLIILCLAYAGVMDMPAFQFAAETWWIAFPSLAAFLISAHTGFRLLRTGWKYDVVSAEKLLKTDRRPPVVYLRSFEADSEIVLRPAGFWNRSVTVVFDYMMTFSPEQELAEVLNRVGPVIAIGKPGEPLPELGAARLYVSDVDWKAKVTDMIARSRLVVIRTGSTPNLQWEIEQTMARVPRRHILFVSLGDAKRTAFFDQYFSERFGRVLPSSAPAAKTGAFTKLMSTGKYVTGRIIFFDEMQQPREEPIRLSMTWSGLALGLMRPYRDSIQAAMQRVFASLELPWAARYSQTSAVLLAMVGGSFGLHHFYMGDRRRGFRYLAFFWTSVPMFAGWYDAVRMARINPQEFDAKYGALRCGPGSHGYVAEPEGS
ncbi:MAG: TM2 domain-containing protein [Rhodoferax sp.]|nr:TM2 domain-containing protein [Rhodoferax sp.]